VIYVAPLSALCSYEVHCAAAFEMQKQKAAQLTNCSILILRAAEVVINDTEQNHRMHLHLKRAVGVQMKSIHCG
jgi:hypothetical protein